MTPKKRNQLFKQFIEAYEKSAGNISVSCKAIGISRNCFYEWRKNYPEFEESFIESEESLIDIVETKLMKNINEGKTTEIIFFLKTKAKHRGYIETTENINHDVSKYKGKTKEELKQRLDELRRKHK